MKPMRKVFALNYIRETVCCYEGLVNCYYGGLKVDEGELRWEFDVLTKYFKVTHSHKLIDEMEERFDIIKHLKYDEPPNNIPYIRDLENRPSHMTNYWNWRNSEDQCDGLKMKRYLMK